MSEILDLDPAARRMAGLLGGAADAQLSAPTPCPDYSLGDLIDHIGGFSLAFTAAATKDVRPGPSPGPSGDATRLDPDWRSRIPEQLGALSLAWGDPSAWEGTTRAAGMELPGAVAGAVALNELVIHGWDIARASDQPFDCGREELEACRESMAAIAASQQRADGGPFGPVVAVPESAPLLDRVIGQSGRDPSWTPA